MTLRDSLARILRRLNRTTKLQGRRQRRRLLLENMEERRLMAIDLQLMTAEDGMAIYGAAAGDWSGVAVSRAGDVNGDGFEDMLVGAAYGDNGAKSNTGASYLVFGAPNLPRTLDLANLGSAGVRILGADAGDGSGATLGSADINGDGLADLIIGSPTADGVNNGRPNSGETYVIFGSATLPSVIDLSVAGSAGLTIYGAGNGDQSGSAVASAGDVNGDGYADFVIGASYADGLNNSKADSGESYLIYGAATLPSSIDLANLQTGQATVFLGIDAGDASGYAVGGAGDVNGDGLADLLIGAIYGSGETNSTRTADTGESYLIFGSRTLPATVSLRTLGAGGMTIYGADANELSGVSVSGAGDVNGDGFDDFLIGSFLSDGPTNSTFAVGLTNLIFGGTNLPTTLNLANLGARGISMYGNNYFDSVGWAVSSAGDVNADGFDDLLIGATYPSDQPNASYTAKGKTFVVYGAAQLNSQINLSNLGAAGIEYIGGETGDTSGWSVSGVGDVNGDGFSDFLIGAPSADAANNAKSAAGESYLLYGGRQASGVTWVEGTDGLVDVLAVDASLADTEDLLYSYDFNNDGDFLDVGEIVGSPMATAMIPGGYLLDNGTHTVRIRIDYVDGSSSERSLSKTVTNAAPVLAPISDVRVTVGYAKKIMLNFSDLGVRDNDWTAEFDTGSGYVVAGSSPTQGAIAINLPAFEASGNLTVSARVIDKDGKASNIVTFNVTAVQGIVAARRMFYNNANNSFTSPFGVLPNTFNSSGAANGAVDNSKSALISGTSSAANYSNYSRGLNGIIIDFSGGTNEITAADFEFELWNGYSPAGFVRSVVSPLSVAVLRGQGISGSDRIKIVFADNVIQNTWLKIRMLANSRTGLTKNDEFYFGHAIGDVGGNPTSGVFAGFVMTDAADTNAVRANQLPGIQAATITNIYDVNKDGSVNAADTNLIRSSQVPVVKLKHITV